MSRVFEIVEGLNPRHAKRYAENKNKNTVLIIIVKDSYSYGHHLDKNGWVVYNKNAGIMVKRPLVELRLIYWLSVEVASVTSFHLIS